MKEEEEEKIYETGGEREGEKGKWEEEADA